jgi:hypothetical protein
MTHALSSVSMGVEARCRPSKSTAHCHHMKRQPFLCNGCPCRGCCHCHRHHHLRRRCRLHCHCHCRLHCRCRCHCHCRCNRPSSNHCHWPLPLRLLSIIPATISVALPSSIAVAIALAIGHCHLCHRWPLQLPSPSAITGAMSLAISESCCLGTARIVFNQLKQRMLTLFSFVCTVGSALIKAGCLTRCRSAMVNTSVGRQATSSEQLVREVAGSRGAAGGAEGWRC